MRYGFTDDLKEFLRYHAARPYAMDGPNPFKEALLELALALGKYGRHLDFCARNFPCAYDGLEEGGVPECNCGFAELTEMP